MLVMDKSTTASQSAEAITEREAARLSGLSTKWFQNRRATGHVGSGPPGPPFFKIGTAVRYPRQDFLVWLESFRVASTPEERKRRAARREVPPRTP
jgi:predicted DNA-binding transcriptional regulator AlpA